MIPMSTTSKTKIETTKTNDYMERIDESLKKT